MKQPELWEKLVGKAPLQTALRLDERTEAAGSVFTWIGLHEGRIALWEDGTEPLPLEEGYLEAVMTRYARPLSAFGPFQGVLHLNENSTLAHMLYLPRFDVVPKDYLVWKLKGQEPVGELCAHLLPPLLHLARRARSIADPPELS